MQLKFSKLARRLGSFDGAIQAWFIALVLNVLNCNLNVLSDHRLASKTIPGALTAYFALVCTQA